LIVVIAFVIFAVKLVEAAFVLLLIDVTAPETCEFVFALMFAANEVEAARTAAFVLALIPVETPAIDAPSELEAFNTFVFVVPTLVPTAANVAPRLVEARSVCELTAEEMTEFCALVFAFMLAANEVEAVAIAELVFALIFIARLDDAFRILVFAVVIFVLAVASVAPSELEAFVTSDCTASEPDDRPAPVSVRVPKVHTCEAVRPEDPLERARPMLPGVVRLEVATFQTADTRVPKVSSERPLTAQTAVGMVEAREVEAVRTVASV